MCEHIDTIIVWFRNDLRIHDNPALWEAAQRGKVIPVFIQSTEENKVSEASHWWLHHSLIKLQDKLHSLDNPLIIRSGNPEEVLTKLINDTNADAVFFNERYEPSLKKVDRYLIRQLTSNKVEVQTFHGHLLFNPNTILNKSTEPYKVFTSFWKRCLQESVPLACPTPLKIDSYGSPLASLTVQQLNLLPISSWYKKFDTYWEPGEDAGIDRWHSFIDDGLETYSAGRDFPNEESISQLSPYFAHGEISVKAVWHSAKRLADASSNIELTNSIHAFLRQLIWRDFAYHQLIHFPTITHSPLRKQFLDFPWVGTAEQLDRWKKGLTGYPLIDAGMRELWETGVMHNRVRMVVASFLVKHLLISWTEGSNWFKETLVDFDVANNAMGWQWVSGCGIDTAPYFRIFNPILQSEKFDQNGRYIRKWIPELDKLPLKNIHRPWEATPETLDLAKVILGKTYPLPMIDHSYARKRSLAAYNEIKNK